MLTRRVADPGADLLVLAGHVYKWVTALQILLIISTPYWGQSAHEIIFFLIFYKNFKMYNFINLKARA